MFQAVGCGDVPPPPKSTIVFVSKPRSMQLPHTPKAPPRKSPDPRVHKMVRPNKYACHVVCVVARVHVFHVNFCVAFVKFSRLILTLASINN